MLPVTHFCMISSYAASLVILFLYAALILRDTKVLRSFNQINFILIGYILLLFYTFYSYYTEGEASNGVSCFSILIAFVFLNLRILYFIVKSNNEWLIKFRVLIIIVPVAVVVLIYIVAMLFNFEFYTYKNIIELFKAGAIFEVSFSALLLLLYSGYFIWIHYLSFKALPHISSSLWSKVYLVFNFVIFVFFAGVSFNIPIFLTLYYYLLISFISYIVYYEIFRKEAKDTERVAEHKDCAVLRNKMFLKLDKYMKETKAWRDPDITMATLVRHISTNRTTFALIMKENGYDNYSCYINQYRIADFINLYNSKKTENYQDIFYDVGFRSRATALRNFKQITGMTPSEFFRLKPQEQIAYTL